MTAPVTGITPIYGLEYPIEGEPIRYTRQKLERTMLAIEEALSLGGVAAPGASDLLAVSGRVSTLEAAAASRPIAVLTGTGTLSLATNTWTALPLTGSEVYDPLGGHSTTVNTSRFTVPVGWGGWWQAIASTRIDSSTGRRGCEIRVNGADFGRSQNIFYGTGGAYVFGSLPCVVQLAAGDYVEAGALQDTGGALNCNLGFSSLTLVRLFPT
jgi:hypothetical protein